MRLYTLIYMSFFGKFLVLFITYSEIQTYIKAFSPISQQTLDTDINFVHTISGFCNY